MKIETDICHICLEYVNYIPEEDIRHCCQAFICKGCWTDLLESSLITQCPICRRNMFENNDASSQTIDIITEDIPMDYSNVIEEITCCSYYIEDLRGNIQIINIMLISLIIGYLITNLVVYIINFNDSTQYFEDIVDVSSEAWFWVFCMGYGYLILCLLRSLIIKIRNRCNNNI